MLCSSGAVEKSPLSADISLQVLEDKRSSCSCERSVSIEREFMKKSKYWFLISVIVLLCCILPIKLYGISGEEQAQFGVYGFSTLHGLEGVDSPRVSVMDRTISDMAKSFTEGSGLDELDEACLSMSRELQEEIVLLIKKAGIKIVPIPNSDIHSSGVARLGVDVTVRKLTKNVPFYAFTVQTELTQEVQLVRDPKIRTEVSTWPNSIFRPNIFFAASFAEMKEAVRGEVTTQIKKFIEDYLAANPKKQTVE